MLQTVAHILEFLQLEKDKAEKVKKVKRPIPPTFQLCVAKRALCSSR